MQVTAKKNKKIRTLRKLMSPYNVLLMNLLKLVNMVALFLPKKKKNSKITNCRHASYSLFYIILQMLVFTPCGLLTHACCKVVLWPPQWAVFSEILFQGEKDQLHFLLLDLRFSC